jgi:4-hydroxy-tetrahydrodipicolinate synthase
MNRHDWSGVMPAITTPFDGEGRVDHGFLSRHARWLAEHGAAGIVGLGSLGEGGCLDPAEKRAVLQTLVEACPDIPIISGIAAMSTGEAVRLARDAEALGCQGLMVLPPYAYPGDRDEISAHMRAVFQATGLSGMLYNNPIAYLIDFTPDWVAELAEDCPSLHSIKESSADIRRIRLIRSRIPAERLAIFAGVDDLTLEALQAGAEGLIAGLVNAFPIETQRLFELAQDANWEEAEPLYRWFLPLLRLDIGPHFVQGIKMAQAAVGMGSEAVRPPRLPLAGRERAEVEAIIAQGLAARPVGSDS